MLRNYGQMGREVHNSVGDVGIKLIGIGIFITGLMSLGSYMFANSQLSKSAGWYPAEATIEQIGNDSLPMPIVGRFLPIVCPFAEYTYTVNGRAYIGRQNCGPSISWIRMISWKQPELAEPTDEKMDEHQIEKEIAEAKMDGAANEQEAARKVFSKHMESAFKLHYKPVKVRYDKDHPDQSALDPDVMQGERSQLNSSLVLMVIGGIVFAFTYMHAFMNAPSPDDPSLSLEAALKHQRRGGR
jgi:hypothetical protein